MLSNKAFLSCAIVTFNEERILEKTLSAIDKWIDEIVVVDSFSTDNTINILEIYHVKLYQEKWRGYSEQKNYALSKCTGKWILALDADEVVSPALKKEILQVLKDPGDKIGFWIPRKFYIGNKWIKYGGYFPDCQLRLFKNNMNAHFKQRQVHESIVLDGKTGCLKNSLEHYSCDDIKDYKKSLEKYAELASKEIQKKKFYVPCLRALWSFIFRYFIRLGFLEGINGFELTLAYSAYVYKKYFLARGKHNKSLLKSNEDHKSGNFYNTL